MTYDPDDTIVAIATASGGAARGMVRVSGPATAEIVAKCFAADNGDPIASLRSASAVAGRCEVRLDDLPPRPLPCDLLFWPTERSYTRQPVAEFHTLGSPPLLRATLEAVCRAGARLAEPGEFTLRAFLAGRIDLTQAEAVLGVIDARQEDELHAAVEQLAGNLARPLHQLRDELLSLLAELEAGLDFVEEDIEFISAAELTARLESAVEEIRAVSDQMSSRLAATATCQVALVGAPNAGKSSLFNALAERYGPAVRSAPTAIVSNQRGTTRDYLTTTVEFRGNFCELIDTAGVDMTSVNVTTVDAAAQEHATQQRRRALMRILCIDANGSSDTWRPVFLGCDLIALTKCDLVSKPVTPAIEWPGALPIIATSSVTGAGLDELGEAIAVLRSTSSVDQRSRCVAATADRCRDSLRLADAALARGAQIAAAGAGDELVAAESRVALAELGKVVGAIYTDDLLDRIFKTFCIGK